MVNFEDVRTTAYPGRYVLCYAIYRSALWWRFENESGIGTVYRNAHGFPYLHDGSAALKPYFMLAGRRYTGFLRFLEKGMG